MSLLEQYMEKGKYLIDNFLDEDEEDQLLRELDRLWYAMTEVDRDLSEEMMKDYSNSKERK